MTKALRTGGLGLALLTALAAAISGTAPVAAAAAATPPTLSHVTFADDCSGTTVEMTSGTFKDSYQWWITVDGEQVWPGADDTQPAPGDSVEVRLPRTDGLIEVDFEGSPPIGWPKRHTWQEPRRGCPIPEVIFEDQCFDGVTWIRVTFSNDEDATGKARFFVDGLGPVELAPGVTAGPLWRNQDQVVVTEEKTGTEWVHDRGDVCETPSPEPSPEPTPAPPAAPDGGGAGELPMTGPTAAKAGTAGALLLLFGAGLVWLVRRRRVSFTA